MNAFKTMWLSLLFVMMMTGALVNCEGCEQSTFDDQSTVSPDSDADTNANANESDIIAPLIISTTPVDGAFSVPVDQILNARFTESMDASTINAVNFILTGPDAITITGTVDFDPLNKKATFTPDTDLDSNTTYTATITTGVKDVALNALESDYIWEFTAEIKPAADVTPEVPPEVPSDITAPTLSLTIPLADATDVPFDQILTATFSEEMNLATINQFTFVVTDSDANPVTGAVVLDDTKKIATFTPDSDFASNTTYTATITSVAKDLAGNALAGNYVWSFETQPRDNIAWTDLGVIYTAPIGDAYYPSVLYDAGGFGVGGPTYAMWYSDGTGILKMYY
ncbi:MAG: Ig-like domain-containing protein [Deltaproteobacteria bacterium]|nr:Ig-like domain-containing protein [Deltaproteobacteria bacterium]